MIGEIYREAGLLELGHFVKVTEKDLVAGYVGQTVLKTAEKIADAMGGILFIDEAYSLKNSEFGEQAATTILEAMSDKMGEFAVIIAGYHDEIDEFLAINPGFASRFDEENTITIPDYKPETLQIIFEERVKKEQRQLDKQLETKLPDFFANWYTNRDEKTFGNARDVLNLYQKMEQHRASRIRKKKNDSQRFTLTMEDVPERLHPYLKPRQPENLNTIQGHTTRNVRKVLKESMDGVLFIIA